jgi:hypothetical protein
MVLGQNFCQHMTIRREKCNVINPFAVLVGQEDGFPVLEPKHFQNFEIIKVN